MAAKYEIGTRVEAEGWDNSAKDVRFQAGTVSRIDEVEGGLRDVTVSIDGGGIKVVRTGKRGGGRQIRLLEG